MKSIEEQIEIIRLLSNSEEKTYNHYKKLVVDNFLDIHIYLETTYKALYRFNLYETLIQELTDKITTCQKWYDGVINSFIASPYLDGNSSNSIYNMETVWKNECLLEVCHKLKKYNFVS